MIFKMTINYASTELVVEGQDDGIDEPESRPV